MNSVIEELFVHNNSLKDENERMRLRVEELEQQIAEMETGPKNADCCEITPEHAVEIETRALETYGAEAQILMVFEEMAELQKELCKNFRGEDNRLKIAEEIADVEIMLDQMCLLYECAGEVFTLKRQKLSRLEKRLDEATAALKAYDDMKSGNVAKQLIDALHKWDENEPLTVAELVATIDEPIFIRFLDDGFISPAILDALEDGTICEIWGCAPDNILLLEEYGITWIAYRNRPEA